MRRRGAAGAENAENGEKQPKEPRGGQKYSVMMYVSVLFTVVIFIILLSYFAQQRSSSRTIESITRQHAQFSTSALERIENLQDSNIALIEKVDEYENALSDLEEVRADLERRLADAEESEEALRTEFDALQKKYGAVSDLMRLEAAISARDMDKAAEIAKALEAQKDYLGEFSGKFQTLKAQLR